MKREYGINSDCIAGQSEITTLELIKKIGFSSFFTNACNNEKVKELKAKADELGLTFEFIHAPFRGINAIWEEGDGYLSIYNGMIEAIDSASNNNIPSVIIHTSSGWNPPNVSEIGIERYDNLLKYSKEKGVNLVLENLRSYKHLACFTDRYKNESFVKYCFDFGHQHCYTPTVDFISIFADKTAYTHIHDNHGYIDNVIDGDEHLLPFDGTCDYNKIINDLETNNYTGSLMLEVSNSARKDYKELSAEEFILTAFERAKKL
jgi:sugar phosphate isomerase/epimerase